jgi:hypothetical protein
MFASCFTYNPRIACARADSLNISFVSIEYTPHIIPVLLFFDNDKGSGEKESALLRTDRRMADFLGDGMSLTSNPPSQSIKH